MPKPKSLVPSIFRAVNDFRCKAWDVVHGVDTCGEIPLESFNFESNNKSPGLEYHSHHPSIIRDGLKASGIDFKKHTFIDYGCGKGRALLVASKLPFRKIIGLEFVPQLAEIARRNVKNYRGGKQLCTNIEVITGDAMDYRLPDDPAFLYFYSPFTPQVVDVVFQNIERSQERAPRELTVLYTGVVGRRDRAFGRPPYHRVLRSRYFDIYKRITTKGTKVHEGSL